MDRATTPSSIIRDASAPQASHAATIEGILTALQNNHRLAIHMVETADPIFGAHLQSIDDFNAVAVDQINESLKNNHPSLFSMSLLPPRKTGMSMRPYEISNRHTNNYGYLFDLSQYNEASPKVARAQHTTLASDPVYLTPRRKHKRLRLDNHTIPTLHKFYLQFHDVDGSKWEKNIITSLGEVSGGSLTEQQLDILGKAYLPRDYEIPEIAPGIVEYNEVLVAAHSSHIRAIVIPFYNGRSPGTESEFYTATVNLQAAITGIDHQVQGYDLPVVLYHVNGQQKGMLTFVGQTKQELQTIALTSLRSIIKNGLQSLLKETDNFSDYAEAIKKHTGVDINLATTPAGKLSWLQKIDQQLAVLTAAPAPALQ